MGPSCGNNNNTGYQTKSSIAKLRKDSTDIFDFFIDEAGASFLRVMMEAEHALEEILKGQAPKNSKGKSLFKKPNGKLYCAEGDDNTFQIRIRPTRNTPEEQALRLLFRWSDLYYQGYHCLYTWYLLDDSWEITLPSQGQVRHGKIGIQFLPVSSSYSGMDRYVTVSIFDLMKLYNTLMNTAAILEAEAPAYFENCQMAFPAVVFSEALRNLIFRRWVFNQLSTTNGASTPGKRVPRGFGLDFNKWSDDSLELFVEDPSPHPKLASRLAIIKRRSSTNIPLLEPQYCSTRRAAAKTDKVPISIVVIGHFNSGKSTTAGHLIYKVGGIDKEAIDAFEAQAAIMDRRSFKYAWVFDKLRAERERGITIDISRRKFDTDNFCCTIFDAPGHRSYVKNMITGISQADCAVLMLDSTGDFEAGISKDDQICEHIALASAFGVKQMICCCNKMDATTPKYSQAQYEKMTKETRSVLKKFQYNANAIPFVPISGLEGENLVEHSLKLDWYKGPTLLEALDQIKEPRWPWRSPLRLPLRDVFRIGGITVSVGCVKTGVLTPGMAVTFTPTGLTSEVQSVQMDQHPIRMALPGDNVGFVVEEGVMGNNIKRGHVVSESDPRREPAKEAVSFTGTVIVLEHDDVIRNGSELMLHCHTAHTCVKISEILTERDKHSGKVLQRYPKLLTRGKSGLVNMIPIPTKPIVVELMKKFPALGRFALRNGHRVVAVGVIETVEVKKAPEPKEDMDG